MRRYPKLFLNLFISLLRGLALPVLRRRTQYLGHEVNIPKATYAPWLKDQIFQDVYLKIKHHTLVDIYRCYELWTLVKDLGDLRGDILEVGVWRGGTGSLMAYQSQRCGSQNAVYLCDTFEGVVHAGHRDTYYKGREHHDASEASVNQITRKLALKNVRTLKGIFPQQTGHFIQEKRFKLCHIDVDVYNSARSSFEWIWDRLEVGGVVVFDDFGFPGCSGVTEYVEEIRYSSNKLVIHNLNGHAIVLKVPSPVG